MRISGLDAGTVIALVWFSVVHSNPLLFPSMLIGREVRAEDSAKGFG